MPTDYSKLKNAELEALLKERQLPAGGKKAEMVARLTEHDHQQQSSTSAAPAAAAAAPAAKAATSEPAAAAIAAGGTGTRVANPAAVPNQKPAIDPSATADLTATKDTTISASAPLAGTEGAKDAAADAAPAALAFESNLKLAPTDIDAEIAKRKARAAKFGISESENDAIKALERAKRFGTGPAAEGKDAAADSGALGMSRLDAALPERGGRKRGRGGDADSWEDEGLKKRRGGGGLRGRGGGGGGGGPKGEKREGAKGTPSWMTEADRAAAEKRKAKFATASTAS